MVKLILNKNNIDFVHKILVKWLLFVIASYPTFTHRLRLYTLSENFNSVQSSWIHSLRDKINKVALIINLMRLLANKCLWDCKQNDVAHRRFDYYIILIIDPENLWHGNTLLSRKPWRPEFPQKIPNFDLLSNLPHELTKNFKTIQIVYLTNMLKFPV